MGRPKNIGSYSKLILCCSLPNITPYNKFQPNRMKNAEVKIFKIFDPQNFFENTAKTKLSKLEPFAWSYWIRKYLFYLRYKFRPRSRPFQKMAQLSQTFARKNWKTSFLNEDQKDIKSETIEKLIPIEFDFFPIRSGPCSWKCKF